MVPPTRGRLWVTIQRLLQNLAQHLTEYEDERAIPSCQDWLEANARTQPNVTMAKALTVFDAGFEFGAGLNPAPERRRSVKPPPAKHYCN